jgi:predicted RNase H-like HicB family nuclease
MRVSYTVHFEPTEEGGYTVTVPALPGAITEGDTFEEALGMAQECILGYLETLQQLGEPIPVEAEPKSPVSVRMNVEAPEAA